MFRRILLWFAGMLAVSFAAFWLMSYLLQPRAAMRDDMFRRTMRFQVGEAIHAYETGGAPALRLYLQRVDSIFLATHHLVDRQGRDLATGADLSQMTRDASVRPGFRWLPPKRFLVKRASADGRYNFLAEGQIPWDPWRDIGIYGWIVVVIVLLCYALAWTLAKPIQQLREVVVRFGQGDLASRSHSRRHDELGELGRAFDQMAERIETLLTAERRLLQDISHELRSPLARLRFAVELARSGSATPAAFSRITKEVDRLATLVDELLQVTRAEGDPGSRNVSVIDLSGFLSSIVQDCQIEADARGCRLELQSKERIQWSGDRELLHRAIENVLRNAVRHTEPETTVEVELKRESGWVVVEVRDHGPGVPEGELAKIFEPFYRVDEDRNRHNGGVGLGLAIAHRAIRVHHGEIAARNLDPGLAVQLKLPQPVA